MILELAILDVRPGERGAFETAFDEAKSLIAASPGFGGLELRHCVETPDRYVLLVKWETLEAHTEGFRGSAAFEEWRRLLHHFYDPKPTAEHFESFVQVTP